LVFKQLTTGAGNDIERATELARKMVCEWGMSDKLGPLTFGKKEEEIFLGREIATHRDFSEKTAEEIDVEIRSVVLEAEKKTHTLLAKNLQKLHALAGALLEREILDGEEIDIVLKGKPLPEKANAKKYAAIPSKDGKKEQSTKRKATKARSRKTEAPVEIENGDAGSSGEEKN